MSLPSEPSSPRSRWRTGGWVANRPIVYLRILKLRVLLAECVAESVTVTVTLLLPCALGVPEMIPVVDDNVRPGGKPVPLHV